MTALQKDVEKCKNFELKVYQLQEQLKDVEEKFQTEKENALEKFY